MDMNIENLSDDVTKINLVGRLDISGALQIDLDFNTVAGSHRKIIVDLEQVPFLASMGIRTLVVGAKAVRSKGGSMVVLKPTPDVEKVLVSSGIDTFIPILHDLDAAIHAVTG
jgi:anti-sigma B factor antagonist